MTSQENLYSLSRPSGFSFLLLDKTLGRSQSSSGHSFSQMLRLNPNSREIVLNTGSPRFSNPQNKTQSLDLVLFYCSIAYMEVVILSFSQCFEFSLIHLMKPL